MALSSASELITGHIYKFECSSQLSSSSTSHRIYYHSIGYFKTNNVISSAIYPTGSGYWFGYYGSSNPVFQIRFGDTDYTVTQGYASFVGSFYFIFDSYSGTIDDLLPYITEVKDWAIFDRTANDVAFAKKEMLERSKTLNHKTSELKGCLNGIDVARIEANCKMLLDDLSAWGYTMQVYSFTYSWRKNSILNSANVSRIIENVNKLKTDFYEPYGWEELPTTMKSYIDINKIEKDIYLMRVAFEETKAMTLKSGTFNA